MKQKSMFLASAVVFILIFSMASGLTLAQEEKVGSSQKEGGKEIRVENIDCAKNEVKILNTGWETIGKGEASIVITMDEEGNETEELVSTNGRKIPPQGMYSFSPPANLTGKKMEFHSPSTCRKVSLDEDCEGEIASCEEKDERDTLQEKYLSNLASPAGVHVILNKPGIKDNFDELSHPEIEEMENKSEVSVEMERGGGLEAEEENDLKSITYRSHYDRRAGVIIFREPEESPSPDVMANKLNIIIELPFHLEKATDETPVDETVPCPKIQKQEGGCVVVSDTNITMEEFDFREALETELKWLKDKNLITGISDKEIEGIASTVEVGSTGYNVRTQYRDRGWVVGPETGIKMQGLSTPRPLIKELPEKDFEMQKLSGERDSTLENQAIYQIGAVALIIILLLIFILYRK